MSSSHKGGRPSGGASGGKPAFRGKPSNGSSHSHKKGKQDARAPVAHTVDRDYMDTLQSQMEKEKKGAAGKVVHGGGAAGSFKKKPHVKSAAEVEEDDIADELSAADVKKAMASVERGDDDAADKKAASNKKPFVKPGHANAKVTQLPGESDEAYKGRLKTELRKRKQEKKKQVRSTVITEKMAEAHAAALERRAEKQRLHLERQAAERAAKHERMAKEAEAGEDGLTNKERRLRKEKQDADDAEAASAAAASKPAAQTPKPAAAATPAAPKAAVAAKAAPVKTSTTVAKSSSKPSLAPADLTTPLPEHHDWEAYNLHPSILRALLIDMKFLAPTPIQAEVLIPAIRDWKDISAAATTGSGKTLAFGIPIIHRLLTLQEAPGWTDPQKIQALILTPTRELALQIVQHLEAISRYASPAIGVTAIVGGISEDKQKRVLDKKHPAVVVATPGRLWELIEEAQLSHLSSAYYLRFLVLDEADRMIDFGHFAELERILRFIETHSGADSVSRNSRYKKAVEVFDGFEMMEDEKPAAEEEEAEEDAEEEKEPVEEEDEDVSEQAKRAVVALQGKSKKSAPKKAAASNSDDIDWDSFLTEEEIFRRQGKRMPKESSSVEEATVPSDDEDEEGAEAGEDEEDQEDAEQDEDEEMEDAEAEDADEEEDQAEEEEKEGSDAEGEDSALTAAAASSSKTLRRQIFLFSATLMLPTSGREDASKVRSQKGRKKEPLTVLDKLADKITFQKNATPFTVDLSTTHQVAATLQEVRAECVTEDKDYLAYYFLLLYPGKTLVFVNSISCLRRLVNLLAALQMPVLGLHAEMQQKARLKSLERFKSQDNSILVCTDVAARGLDIPAVPYIIHYQLPRTAEVYIHRSGRVARAGAVGLSCALVDEKDTKNYRRLCLVLKKVNGIPPLPVDQGFMTQIRERMHVARQLDLVVNADRKANSKRDWFVRQAEAMDMEIDEDELQISKNAGGDSDDEAANAEDEAVKKGNLQRELAFLLSKPLMHGTLSRKFYTLNATRGFDLNKESAGIAKAGAASLEKNGTIRAGAPQNSAVGTVAYATDKLPPMLKKARESDRDITNIAAGKAPTPKKKAPAPQAAAKAAPPAKVVTSLSAKRKEPEPETEVEAEAETAAPVAPSTPAAKKQKTQKTPASKKK